jgi:hypothetical protein
LVIIVSATGFLGGHLPFGAANEHGNGWSRGIPISMDSRQQAINRDKDTKGKNMQSNMD